MQCFHQQVLEVKIIPFFVTYTPNTKEMTAITIVRQIGSILLSWSSRSVRISLGSKHCLAFSRNACISDAIFMQDWY